MSVKRKLAEPPTAYREFSCADIMGIPVVKLTVQQFSLWLLDRAAMPQPDTATFVTYLNAACSNIAADDADYREILCGADCVYADGQAVVWAGDVLRDQLPERVNAGDFIVELCRELAGRRLKLALVGGRRGVAQAAANAWEREAPGLCIVGAWDGFFEDGGEAACKAVSESGADLVLVGMGVPLQEKWVWARREEFGAKVIWCVGALFEYYGEDRARAPVWMRRVGLEWLFRLALEPRRLWRRYLIGNVRFVARVFRARFSRNG